MRTRLLAVVLATLLAACAALDRQSPSGIAKGPTIDYRDPQRLGYQYAKPCERASVEGTLDAVRAIGLAQSGPEYCQPATFKLFVRNTEHDPSGHLFLDSAQDYHDPRNLAVVVELGAQFALEREFGRPIERIAYRHEILVTGVARRIRIDYFDRGRPTGRFYYQTHVLITDPAQLEMAGTIERGLPVQQ